MLVNGDRAVSNSNRMSLNSSRMLFFNDSVGSQPNINDDALERESHRKRTEGRLSTNTVQKQQFAKDAQLHMNNYMQLFSENKIVASNAWMVNAIDCLKYIFDANDDNNILNIGPDALEVGTKVYTVRVDDAYSSSLVFSHELSSKVKSRNVADKDKDNDDEPEEECERRKKPKILTSYIAKNSNEIDDEPVTKISIFNQLQAILNEKGEKYFMGSLLINSLNGCQRLIDTDKSSNKYNKNWEPIEDISFMFKLPESYKNEVCEPLTKFSYRQCDPDSSRLFDGLASTFSMDDFDHPVADVSFLPHNVDIDDDHFAQNDDGNEEMVQDRQFISNLAPTRESIAAQSDYSHSNIARNNNSLVNLWAGPKHWKLKLLTRKGIRARNENPRVLKRVYVRRKADYCDFHELDYDLEQCMEGKIEKVYSYFNDDFYRPKKFIFPENYNFGPESILSMILDNDTLFKFGGNITLDKKQSFLMNGIGNNEEPVNDNSVHIAEHVGVNNSHFLDDNLENASYNYENPNDSQFLTPEDDNLDSLGMVIPPEQIAELKIDYDRNPSHINIKKLKEGIKRAILDDNVEDIENKRKKMDFKEIYRKLPVDLPPKMKQELEPTVAFSGLLQVAYENKLKLVQYRNTILIEKREIDTV